MDVWYKVVNEDCLKWLDSHTEESIHLTFIDPPLDRERIIDFLMIINPKRDTGSGWEMFYQKFTRLPLKAVLFTLCKEKKTENDYMKSASL